MAFDQRTGHWSPERWGPGWGAPGMPVHPGFSPMASPAVPAAPASSWSPRGTGFAGGGSSTALPGGQPPALPSPMFGGAQPGAAVLPRDPIPTLSGNWLAALYGGGGQSGMNNPWLNAAMLAPRRDQDPLFRAMAGGLNLFGGD